MRPSTYSIRIERIQYAEGPMMRRAYVSLLVLLSLLATVSDASAECAWVLWESGATRIANGFSRLPGWSPETSVSTLSECRAEIANRLRSWSAIAELGGKRHVLLYSESAQAFEKEGSPTTPDYMFIQYKCLPNSVDPRGPKGSGR